MIEVVSPKAMSISTERLVIRTMNQEDLPAIFACYNHPEVGRFCAPVRWPDMDYALTWFHRRSDDVASGRAKQLVIIANSSNVVIGTAVLFSIDTVHRNAEVGYALGRDFWGLGYANEAVSAVIDYAFGELQLHRLNATIDPRNTASARVLARLGFQYEGTQRESYFDAGQYTDAGLYGLLATDWKKLPVGAGDTLIM